MTDQARQHISYFYHSAIMASAMQNPVCSADYIDILRSELVEEMPRAEQLVAGISKMHKVYLRLYKEASDFILPEIIISELKFHIKNHFSLFLFVTDELQFLIDGKVIRSNKYKMLISREFIHPSRKNDFKFGESEYSQSTGVSLCTKSVEGYYFEEQILVRNMKRVSTILPIFCYGDKVLIILFRTVF